MNDIKLKVFLTLVLAGIVVTILLCSIQSPETVNSDFRGALLPV